MAGPSPIVTMFEVAGQLWQTSHHPSVLAMHAWLLLFWSADMYEVYVEECNRRQEPPIHRKQITTKIKRLKNQLRKRSINLRTKVLIRDLVPDFHMT